MKRSLRVLALLLAVALVALASGCGGQSKPSAPAPAAAPAPAPAAAPKAPAQSPAPAAPAKSPQAITLASGGTAGTYYIHANAIAQVLNKKLGNLVNVTSVTTAASSENVRLLNSGRSQFALVAPNTLFAAINGVEDFKSGKITNMRLVLFGFTTAVHLVVPADSPLKSLEEFKGKRISIGAPGSATYPVSLHVLGSVGLGLNDIKQFPLSFAETVDAFRNKTIDAAILPSGVPFPAVVDLASSMPVRLLPFPKASLDKLTKEYPYYYLDKIKGGVYRGQDSDVEAIHWANMAVVREDADPNLVYQMVKAVTESAVDMKAVHVTADTWTLKNSKGRPTLVPWHPGAEKYLKEIGEL